MTSDVVQRLTDELGDKVGVDVALGERTTFRVGGSARVFVSALDDADVVTAAAVAREYDVPLLVIGRGSNMLVADDGFAGIVVSLAGVFDELVIDGDTGRCVVGGGVELPKVARQTAAAGLSGFEWAVGVPGSIGGAVRMNAGGHGSDMAASLVDVDLVDLDGGAGLRTASAESLGLRFRSSSLSPSSVVVRARLQLSTGNPQECKALISDIVRWRREHQPGGQNCGSVFVNPVPGRLAAAELIDGCGLRGLRIGSASVSDKHANFIQADPGGRAADVNAVIEHVRAKVAAQTGFLLRSEVRLVGFEELERPC